MWIQSWPYEVIAAFTFRAIHSGIFINNSTWFISIHCVLLLTNHFQSEVLNIDGITFLILLNINEENVRTSQAGVEIWCLHESQFGIRQVLYFSDPPPKSISAITYRGYHYLSIVYRGGIQQGHIDILRLVWQIYYDILMLFTNHICVMFETT